MLPISNGRVFWYATLGLPGRRTGPRGGTEGEPLAHFWELAPSHRAPDRVHRRGSHPAQRSLRSPAGASLGKWPGDPAWRCRSSPTPNLGQGACQALEDALVLAGCLFDLREPVAADAAPTRHAAGSAAPPSPGSPPWSERSGNGSSRCCARYGMGSPRSPSRRCSPDCLSQMLAFHRDCGGEGYRGIQG
jgi:hypothetical protein